jgi:hypothetical protein
MDAKLKNKPKSNPSVIPASSSVNSSGKESVGLRKRPS